MHTTRHLFFLLALSLSWARFPHRRALPHRRKARTPSTCRFAAAPAPTNNPFGFDMHAASSDSAMQFAAAAKPRWSRAGTVFWSDVEPTRGTYNWDALAGVEINVRRLRAVGIEPTLVVQRTPAWAQSVAGRLCSPPKPEALPDFARFMRDVATILARAISLSATGRLATKPTLPLAKRAMIMVLAAGSTRPSPTMAAVITARR